VAADGLRRITPACNFELLIDLGAVGGLAVIHGARGFDPDRDDYYSLMHRIHQYVFGRRYYGIRGMQEHLTRTFGHSRDLFIRPSARHADSERNVLPESVGLTAQGEGTQPSVGQLLQSGREAAISAHYTNPISKVAIRFGLNEAAKLNPLRTESENAAALVQMALFDVESLGDPPTQELVDIVQWRLRQAVSGHQSEPADAFYRWFAGAHSTLIKQIAQQTSQPGGKLAREDVRRTLLHLGVQSLQDIGLCVHALMRTIKNSISPPLDDAEKQLFEHMYECQPYYGNLPAAMLADRMPDLGCAVLAIWDEPDNPEHVGVLHRLLDYYAEMAKLRRQADRQSKNRSTEKRLVSRRPADGQVAAGADAGTGAATASESSAGSSSKRGPVRFHESLHAPKETRSRQFAMIADCLRTLRGIECPGGCTQWHYHREGDAPDEVTINVSCECGQTDETVTIGWEEFAGIAEKVLQLPRLRSSDESHDAS
jgi:hypothetical protein